MGNTAIPEWWFNAVMDNAHRIFGGLSPTLTKALYAEMLRAGDKDSAIDIVRRVENARNAD